MATEFNNFKDLIADEPDGMVRVNIVNRDGSIAIRDVRMPISSPLVQEGTYFTSYMANVMFVRDTDTGELILRTPVKAGLMDEDVVFGAGTMAHTTYEGTLVTNHNQSNGSILETFTSNDGSITTRRVTFTPNGWQGRQL